MLFYDMIIMLIQKTSLTRYPQSIIIILEDQCTALIGAGRKTRVHRERGGSPLFFCPKYHTYLPYFLVFRGDLLYTCTVMLPNYNLFTAVINNFFYHRVSPFLTQRNYN